jgi:hypothetical protein
MPGMFLYPVCFFGILKNLGADKKGMYGESAAKGNFQLAQSFNYKKILLLPQA